jgi:hypothetical protein
VRRHLQRHRQTWQQQPQQQVMMGILQAMAQQWLGQLGLRQLLQNSRTQQVMRLCYRIQQQQLLR